MKVIVLETGETKKKNRRTLKGKRDEGKGNLYVRKEVKGKEKD